MQFAIDKSMETWIKWNIAWTPSINEGEPTSKADQSVGKQLPYIPEYSSYVIRQADISQLGTSL